MIKVGMISLGCSKNQVDAERMMAILQKDDMILEANPEKCDAIIVNTCGFIEAAKTESIETILEFSQLKEQGHLKVIAVTGCLGERYQEEFQESMPEVDVLLGIGSNQHIAAAIKSALNGEKFSRFGEKEDLSMEGERVLANAPHFAYLKVAEGCDNLCTYCAIPSIRGSFRSRPMENIIEEAKTLGKMGVKEINLVAQDTTRYGEDLYGKLMLPQLLKELCKISDIKWIRILYCYPERITPELLETVAQEEKIVKYMDIPLQHASNRILKKMNRVDDIDSTKELIKTVRERIPGVVIRTTVIAGFPDETEKDFEELCDFVEEMKFQRLGAFAYSIEEGTPAAKLPGQLKENVKKRRAEVVMEIQMSIAEKFSATQVGKELEILVEEYDPEEEMYVGRSYMDAPDVDTRVYFTAEKNHIGDFVKVKITDSRIYDLVGKAVEQ